jgi:hypothetical protein
VVASDQQALRHLHAPNVVQACWQTQVAADSVETAILTLFTLTGTNDFFTARSGGGDVATVAAEMVTAVRDGSHGGRPGGGGGTTVVIALSVLACSGGGWEGGWWRWVKVGL